MPAIGAVLVATPATMIAPLIPGVSAASTLNTQNDYFRIADSALGLFGGRAPFDSTINASNHVFVFSCGVSNGTRITDFVNFTTVAGVMFAVVDNVGNWRRWVMLGGQNPIITSSTHSTSSPLVSFSVDPSCTTSMQGASATPPDLTQLVAFELHMDKSVSSASSSWATSSLFLVDKSQGIRLTGAAAFADFAAYQSATNLLFFSEYLDSSTLVSAAPLGIATDSIESAGCTITYLEPASPGSTIRSHIDNVFFAINQPVSGTANLLGWQVKSPQKNLILAQNTFGAGGSVTFNSQIFQNFLTRTIKSGEVFNSSSFLNFNQVTIDGGTLRSCSFSSATSEPSLIINHATAVQFSAEDLAGDIEFNLAPGSYPTLRASLVTGQVFNITQGAGTYTLTGLDNLDAGSFIIDNTGGGAVVAVIASGVDVEVADPLTAGTLTIQNPVQTTTFTGFPTANNSNGVAPSPVIGFFNSSFAFIDALDTSDTEYSSGSFTVLLSDYSGVAYVVGDAIGWVRTDFIPVDAGDPPSAVSLAAAFREIVSETGVALVGNGTIGGKAKLTYDQANTRFEVAAGPITFEDTLDKKEELTSNASGVQNFNTTIVRGIQFISTKYGNEILLPAPLTIAANISALTSPILENFLVVRAGDPTEDPFEHGLTSTAVGLTDRPEIRSISTLFIGATDGSGLSTGQAASLAAIEDYTRPMAKQLGLVPGVTATHTLAVGIVVSDGDGSTDITEVGVNSYQVELA